MHTVKFTQAHHHSIAVEPTCAHSNPVSKWRMHSMSVALHVTFAGIGAARSRPVSRERDQSGASGDDWCSAGRGLL